MILSLGAASMLAVVPCIIGSTSRGRMEDSLPGNGLIVVAFRFESMDCISSEACLEGLPSRERRGGLILLVAVPSVAPNLDTVNFGVAPTGGLTLPGEPK